ncbi:MAG: Sec-independent protein translocase protein TatB [Porticoccaceae bacterium]|nr:twin-arginine translocase subunit TatB [Pseudomonadales bacterium]MCP5172041.1 twin-arginine translocase subunit TatB [Pseudomonadales bacterium]
MFDIGFFELLLIAVVGLLVIGPKRLPEAIRTVGLLVGRLKRTLGAARQEFEKEFGVDEVRRQLHNEDIMRQFGESKQAITDLNKPFVGHNTNQDSVNSQGSGEAGPSATSSTDVGKSANADPSSDGKHNV